MRYWVSAVFLGLVTMVTVASGPVRAEVSPQVESLAQVLQIPEIMAVLRDEGLVSSAKMLEVGEDMPADPVWQGTVGRIYDLAAMEAVFLATLDAELKDRPDTLEKAAVFFGSDMGQRALRLEIEARQALADSDVEATAAAAYGDLAKENPGRAALLDQFVAANDLIESNVMGALNANLAFLRGVAMEGGEELGMTEADMVAQVWSGEAEARAETTKWVFPFLNLAYQPLTDAELQSYVDFSLTPEGQQLNAAMFRAFDKMFDGLSRDLGRAYARHMVGQDI